MNFEELAKLVGKNSGAVRVTFSRQGWSIGIPEHVTAYIEYINRPNRYTAPRPASTAAHLADYRFQSSIATERLLPTLSEAFRQPETRDLAGWLRRPRLIGSAKNLLPEARSALRELAGGLLMTSRDLAGVIITGPRLSEAPSGMLGIIGVYSWLPGNHELATLATSLAEEQSAALGLPVRYLPTDLTRLDATLGNPAHATLQDWLATSRVEYGYAALPL